MTTNHDKEEQQKHKQRTCLNISQGREKNKGTKKTTVLQGEDV